MATDLARHLGRQYVNSDTFALELSVCVDRALATDLIFVASKLSTLMGEHYYCYVEQKVLTVPARAAFYAQAPFDELVLRLRACPHDLLSPDSHVFPCIFGALTAGASVSRLACGLLPTLTKIVSATAQLRDLVKLMSIFAVDDASRPMLHDSDLFFGLSRRVHDDDDDGTVLQQIVHLTTCSCIYDTLDIVAPIVDQCAIFLDRILVGCVDIPTRALPALDILERCAYKLAWRARLVPYILILSRHGWLASAFGILLSHMLSDASVELVLRLHVAMRLDALVFACERHIVEASMHQLSWRTVRGHLRRQWPNIIKKHVTNTTTSIVCTCPITHDACRHPVVSSDGHTYERDALLTHMTHSMKQNNGVALSPMTREVLDWNLYENRAVY